VVKADAYGLGAARWRVRSPRPGARNFFVAVAEEGAALREASARDRRSASFRPHGRRHRHDPRSRPDPDAQFHRADARHFEALPGHPFGLQLDSGMNRLGMEPAEWAAVREIARRQGPALVMSHLACADEPDHPMNAAQLRAVFREMTDGLTCVALAGGDRRRAAGRRTSIST
jgi:alanine racemase